MYVHTSNYQIKIRSYVVKLYYASFTALASGVVEACERVW